MKIKYLIGIIFVLGLGFQFFRVNKLDEIIDVKKGYSNEEVVYSSAKDIPTGEIKSLILISDINSQSQEDLYGSLKEVFGYAKMNYDTKYLKDLDKKEIYRYESIIIATDNYKYLKEEVYKEIKNYVENGGNLIILMNSYFNPFNKVAGIEKIKKFTIENGLKFKKHIFPGMDDTPIVGKYAKSISNSLLDVELNKDVEIIAETSNGSPMIFERKVGDGRIIYSNTTFFGDQSVNGILIQLISYGNNIFLQNIVNTKIIDIDDFPAPLPRGKNKLIYPTYKMDSRKFFREVWWTDMKKMANEKNLVYSGYIIGTYNDITKAENFSEFDENDLQDKIYFGRELLSLNGEIGIHGYNHQPLGRSEDFVNIHGYNSWESKEDMAIGILAIRKSLKEMYGGLEARVYVPPSNMLSLIGKRVLKENLPSLEVLSGLYSSAPEKGVLITKIGWDKDEPSLYNFPRFTSEFAYDQVMMFDMYKGIALYGIVHHFVHPDDILDDERGQGKNWEELKKEFSLYFDNVNDKFGFLRAQTTYKGFREALKLEELKVHVFSKDDTVDVYFENFPGKTYHYFRVRDKKIEKVTGGKADIISYGDRNTLYLIEANKNKISIKLK
jgi:hypothetical protein